MRFTSTIATAALFTGALAQIPNGVLQLVSNLSPQCQQTVFGLIQSPVVECLNLAESINIISQFTSSSASNTSIAVPIDQLLALECASAGCSNATLTSLAQNITSGCGTDLESYGISSSNVTFAIAQYPLVREVVCLRTSDLETENGTSIAEEPSYNVTNGTAYCATTLLATVEDKIDANLTIPFFMDIYRSYQNGSLDQSEYLSNFTQEDLCDECIFAAADVIGVAYPGVGNLTLTSLGFGQNVSASAANTTLAQALDSTCAAEGLQWTSNGTLPANITLGAANSTFGFNLTAGNETYEPEGTSPIVKRNVADIKARWIGQY